MIKWREEFVGSTKVWKTVLDGVSLDRTSIGSAFKAIWVDGARKIAPFYVDKEWNTIRVELLEELGRVRVYPYKFHDQAPAIAGCEIFIPLLKEFIRVHDSEEAPETEEQLEKMINEVAKGNRECWRLRSLPNVFSAINTNRSLFFRGGRADYYSNHS